uniref:Sorting nexin 7 n=1 Tax=Canis lupus familiaris TaxID=9615 RepID=A0A8I3NS75_CANLF
MGSDVLRGGRGAGAGPAGEAQAAREPMGALGEPGWRRRRRRGAHCGDGGRGRRAPRARSCGLPAGGAPAPSPGVDAPLPGRSGPPALPRAEVLDLDEDEDDLEVFSKDASLMDMNSFSPMMPTSPLSMINQVKFEDEPDLKDLFITVDEPESHVTTIETFITYRIITKTSRGEFDSSEFEVRRRYQDFLWLKGKLEEAHPTLIIPPLPEKFIVKGMVERFNDDFIETRRKALHKFLNRIADHPTLTFNEDFKVFLTAQAWELSSHKKQGPGLLSRMGQTVRAVAMSMRGVKSRPEEFMEMNNFIEIFSQKINLIDKISQRIYKEEREYSDEMKEYGPIHVLWSASEEDLVDTLKGVASCIDQCCKATEKRMSGLSEALLPVVHEYVLYSEMLMLTEEIGKLEDKVECANNALKADWERWKHNMQNDIKSAFTDMAEENIHYYEQCLATWESFLASQTDLHMEESSEDKPESH